MGCISEQYLTHLVVIFPPTNVFFSKQQIQILITQLNSIVVMNSDGIANNICYNYHHNYSSVLIQWYCCLILHCINTILYLFINTFYKFTMVDLLIVQLRWISNGMIMNNWVIHNNILSRNNVLFQILSIIFVFGDCGGCKNKGKLIVGINIYVELYIFILKRYFNNRKSISIGLVFRLIITFGDAVDICIVGTKLYLIKEYGNDIGCNLEWNYTTDNNIFVNNDNLHIDYGVFNAFVGFGVIHDNYWCTFTHTIQGYGNNSKELNILRDNQAGASNMFDLSTIGMNTK